MTRARVLLLAATVCLIAACGKAPDAPGAAAQDSAGQATSAPAAADSAATIAAPAPAVEPAASESPVAAVEESASTEAASVADQNPLGKDIVLAKTPATSAAPAAPPKTDWQYAETKHYNLLPTAQGTSSSAGKIEVAEVFWYGCGHCYNLEPLIADWVKTLPADVSFVRIPVMWSPVHEIHGRAYYTAEALGKIDQINPAMFRAIHIDNQPLTEEKDIQALFAKNGVSADDFNRTFRSFSVDSQLKRAKDLTAKYRVRGVPLLVINGKYTTDGPEIRSQQDLLAVTEELIQRERQRS